MPFDENIEPNLGISPSKRSGLRKKMSKILVRAPFLPHFSFIDIVKNLGII